MKWGGWWLAMLMHAGLAAGLLWLSFWTKNNAFLFGVAAQVYLMREGYLGRRKHIGKAYRRVCRRVRQKVKSTRPLYGARYSATRPKGKNVQAHRVRG